VSTSITAVQGDLTTQEVDAIVNAANEHLAHGGGVAAAIVRAGGPIIQDESRAWVDTHGPLSPGVAAVTSAGAMPSRWVIHVAGPRFRPDQDNAGLLATAVAAALDAAVTAGARTIALPAISSGIFGYPLAEATAVIARTARAWTSEHPDALDEVRLVGWDTATTAAFAATLDQSDAGSA
jgi:O-acetyl-ADP-ribose deacetylase (regulator of RNase III)